MNFLKNKKALLIIALGISIGLCIMIIETGLSKFTFKKQTNGEIIFEKEKLFNKRTVK